MYKHILVAVDGSDVSNLALQEAIQLANEMGAELEIVHVVDPVNLNLVADFGDFGSVMEAANTSGQSLLNQAATAARDAGIEAKTHLSVIETLGHRVAEMIVAEAERWPADLVVIGTHGRRGIHHLFLGSIAEGVVRAAGKPVLLIRGNRSEGEKRDG